MYKKRNYYKINKSDWRKVEVETKQKTRRRDRSTSENKRHEGEIDQRLGWPTEQYKKTDEGPRGHFGIHPLRLLYPSRIYKPDILLRINVDYQVRDYLSSRVWEHKGSEEKRRVKFIRRGFIRSSMLCDSYWVYLDVETSKFSVPPSC